MLRVLIFIDTLGAGGAEQVLVNLVPKLISQGLEIEIVSLFGATTLLGELEEQGVKVHLLNLTHRWNIFEAVFKLNKIFTRKSYDVLNGNLYFGGLYALVAKLWFPTARIFQTLHGFEFDRDLDTSLFRKMRRRIRLWVLSSSDHLFAITPSVLEHYQFFLPEAKISVILNPVFIQTVISSIPAAKKSLFQILVPARLIPEKGHEVLLRALFEVLKRNPKFACNFYGEGPLKESLLKEVENLKLEKHVFFSGRVKHSILLNEIVASDLVVLPSLSEGFGIAAAEAMGLGKIVIASDTGGLSDLIKNNHNGFLVKAGDSHAFANAILSVMEENFNLPEIRLKAAFLIKDQYSVDFISQRWLAAYQGNLG